MKKLIPLLFVAVLAVLQTGCVVGRRTMDLPIPTFQAFGKGKGTIAVTTVTDDRKFQNKPSDPSTPSIDGDVNSMSAQQKSMMIGRQRNGFGKALGDIALPAGDSVQKKTKLLVEEALRARGYTVTSGASSPNTASISVDEFWAWFSPGMWTLSFEARITCALTLRKDGHSETVTVRGYGLNHGQVAKDANWQQAYDRAFKDFVLNLQAQLDKTQF